MAFTDHEDVTARACRAIRQNDGAQDFRRMALRHNHSVSDSSNDDFCIKFFSSPSSNSKVSSTAHHNEKSSSSLVVSEKN